MTTFLRTQTYSINLQATDRSRAVSQRVIFCRADAICHILGVLHQQNTWFNAKSEGVPMKPVTPLMVFERTIQRVAQMGFNYFNITFPLCYHYFSCCMFKVEGNYMKKQKKIKLGFIAKKVATLILKTLKIREELKGQRKCPMALNNFYKLSLSKSLLSKSITEGCLLSLNPKSCTMFLSSLAFHG